MNLRKQLKDYTDSLHYRLEVHPLLIKLANQTITMEEYCTIVELFYGWVAKYEACCQQLCQDNLYYKDRLLLQVRWHKTWLLEQDLLDLGYKQYQIKKLPQAPLIDGMNDWLAPFGYLYVIEGATLGGQQITQRLKPILGLGPDHGIHFFNSYGVSTPHMWRHFCHYLNSMTITFNEQQIIIAIAQQIFVQLHDWLSEKTT